MEIEWGTMLVLIRCSALAIIILVVGSYHDPDAKHRRGVSLVAAVMCGSAASWAIYSMTMLHNPNSWARELLPTLFVLAVTVPVVRSHGNVARLFPRIPWSTRP